MNVRNANMSDLDKIMTIYRIAQEFMINNGNPTQWGLEYPARDLILSDIANNRCKVIEDESGIHAVFALFDGIDPTYVNITDGEWLNEEPYLTIHRIASDGKAHGIFVFALDYCKDLTDNIRIDTHQNNLIMQKLIERNGFIKCGIIYVGDGTPRIAYQWSRNN